MQEFQMNKNNQKLKPRMGILKKIIIYIFFFTLILFMYLLIKEKKTNHGLSTALYTGEGRVKEKAIPQKLKWFDSFRGINNMGK